MAETTYSAVHLLAALSRDRVPTVEDARRPVERAAWDSPHGTVELRHGVATHPVHLALAGGIDLHIVARISSPGTSRWPRGT